MNDVGSKIACVIGESFSEKQMQEIADYMVMRTNEATGEQTHIADDGTETILTQGREEIDSAAIGAAIGAFLATVMQSAFYILGIAAFAKYLFG